MNFFEVYYIFALLKERSHFLVEHIIRRSGDRLEFRCSALA
ncbi:hypothetical protein [Nostoc sphaeroides]|uniref:Uncharacterized protein n=1 Tax=Nostoc sphaeroides CCNUC1 TaxID=2653204 RepID=A0A5P8WAL7_9NOSO|nr:hypothetical protein [Nostoc sphaeroides]QFS49216.1 hypothetical protein GXM_06710 [Nostoc sphaeroides CCNUC1]